MIRVNQVTHHYGIRPVLRQIDLEIPKGQVVALMGPNGMGKSTLMGVIAGLLSPLKGTVEIDGKVRRSTAENELAIRKLVAYLPADHWVPGNRTGREWLLAVGRLYGIDDDRLLQHIDRLLALFDLFLQGDSTISSYSTGQKRKIALCCTLVTEAPILLLDEPFSGGLDPSAILALKRVLQNLAARDDVTILMATPVPELVTEIADAVAILKEGRILAYDTLGKLREQTGLANLDEIYERLVAPQTAANIEQYFAGGKV